MGIDNEIYGFPKVYQKQSQNPASSNFEYLLINGKSTMRSIERVHGHSYHVLMCFVSLLNSLFAFPSCTQTQERQAIRGIGKVRCHSGVTIYFQAFPMINC